MGCVSGGKKGEFRGRGGEGMMGVWEVGQGREECGSVNDVLPLC